MKKKRGEVPPWIEAKARKDGSVTYWVRYRIEGRECSVFAGTHRDQAEQKLVEYEIKFQSRRLAKEVPDGVA